MDTAYTHVERSGIMAGMRGAFSPEVALPLCEMLLKEGIHVFEFTYNSQQPIQAMMAVKRALGDDACVGMGTVLDTPSAQRVLDSGADFIVSPAFQPEIVRLVQQHSILMAPGCLTPTEIVAAWDMGVKLVKLFPIGTLGVDHFRQIRGPLDHVNFMCNGGTNDTNVGEFIKAGAIACGLGSWLTGDGTMPLEIIRDRARRLRSMVDNARSGLRTQLRA
jgi:2-dehydro-3-deoxyphosphogluconate aldolase/(4S)-4-hydroxy-2-oxoglutarate aldolase